MYTPYSIAAHLHFITLCQHTLILNLHPHILNLIFSLSTHPSNSNTLLTQNTLFITPHSKSVTHSSNSSLQIYSSNSNNTPHSKSDLLGSLLYHNLHCVNEIIKRPRSNPELDLVPELQGHRRPIEPYHLHILSAVLTEGQEPDGAMGSFTVRCII